jgi:hypothetical protein
MANDMAIKTAGIDMPILVRGIAILTLYSRTALVCAIQGVSHTDRTLLTLVTNIYTNTYNTVVAKHTQK